MPDIPTTEPRLTMQYPYNLVTSGKTYSIIRFRAWEVKPASIDSLSGGPQLLDSINSTITDLGKFVSTGVLDTSSLPGLYAGLTAFISQTSTNIDSIFVNDSARLNNSTRTKIRAPRQEAKEEIYMYLPPDLSTSYNIEYEEQDFTGTDLLFDIIRNSVKYEGDINLLPPELKERALHAIGPKLIDSLTSIIPSAGLNLTGTIAQLRGKIPTPRLEYQFKNVGKRSFTFEFKMFPLDETENKMVHDIIKTFKKYSLPIYDGQFYKFPAEFDISFHSVVNGVVTQDPNAWLFKIKRCVCDSIDINYAPAGYYQSLRPTQKEENGGLDLPPMGISIRLSFKELESLHRDLVENEGY